MLDPTHLGETTWGGWRGGRQSSRRGQGLTELSMPSRHPACTLASPRNFSNMEAPTHPDPWNQKGSVCFKASPDDFLFIQDREPPGQTLRWHFECRFLFGSCRGWDVDSLRLYDGDGSSEC